MDHYFGHGMNYMSVLHMNGFIKVASHQVAAVLGYHFLFRLDQRLQMGNKLHSRFEEKVKM